MNVSRNRHFRRRLVAAPARLAHLERGWRVMIEAGSQRAQRLFSLHFARFPAWPPAPARGCGQRRRRSRRPPQRRQQESPPPPIEAMLRRSEMTKTERCAGGNILAMRCRFAGKAMPDHIHMLLSVPPRYSVAMTIGYLKGKSATRIHRELLKTKGTLFGRSFWARGYCVSTVGLDEDQIRRYIRDQEKLQQD